MSDSENPDSSSTVSPSDAVTETEISEGTETEAVSSAESSGTSISDMLMSTEPDESPDRYPTSQKVAHLLIAGKKMMHASGARVKEGTTALENLIMSGIAFVTDAGAGEESRDEESGEVNGGGMV